MNTDITHMYTNTPSVAEYLPAGQAVQVAVAAEVDPAGAYLPVAHRSPEHLSEPGYNNARRH